MALTTVGREGITNSSVEEIDSVVAERYTSDALVLSVRNAETIYPKTGRRRNSLTSDVKAK